MIKKLNDILLIFRGCFSRKAPFYWFVVIITGFMIRADKLGVTSIIRDLSLSGKHYESILHFFNSSSWNLKSITNTWAKIVKNHSPIYHEGTSIVLIGDGVKQSKEARKMPGVKKMHQESENSSKSTYIHGHMFGVIGILAGSIATKLSCVPLSATMQDGVKSIFGWKENGIIDQIRQETHVVQMISNGFDAANSLGESAILLLDRYFLSVPALKKLNELNSLNSIQMQIVTKAKKNVIAYEDPPVSTGNKGRPRKKGDSVKLNDLFRTKKDCFKTARIEIYGNNEEVSFYYIDLLWGAKLYQKLRFVLVEYKGKQSILVSTDLELAPEASIRLYSYRFKIECLFRENKQVIGGFGYRFWSKIMPRLNRFFKKDDIHPIDQIQNSAERKNIIDKVRAIECYVILSCIALGLLQILAFEFSSDKLIHLRYLRTPSRGVPSEATVSSCLRKKIYSSLAANQALTITQIIKSKQKDCDFDGYFEAS